MTLSGKHFTAVVIMASLANFAPAPARGQAVADKFDSRAHQTTTSKLSQFLKALDGWSKLSSIFSFASFAPNIVRRNSEVEAGQIPALSELPRVGSAGGDAIADLLQIPSLGSVFSRFSVQTGGAATSLACGADTQCIVEVGKRKQQLLFPEANIEPQAGPGNSGRWRSGWGADQTASILGSGASHIGTPGLLQPSVAQREVVPSGLRQGGTDLQESPLRIVEGDPSKHLSTVSSYGSVNLPNGQAIAINNADVSQVLAVKEYRVGPNGGTFTFQSLANFVTTEFPDFVGTEFNDTTTITIRTQGGQSATLTARQLFSASVNSSNFTAVTRLPTPLAGLNENNGGGQTGFREVLARANVAPGSKVTVEFRVQNVGDSQFPSALLLARPTAR